MEYSSDSFNNKAPATKLYDIHAQVRSIENKVAAFHEPGESDIVLDIHNYTLKEEIQNLKDKRKEEFHRLNNLESGAATAYHGSSQDSSDISQISLSSQSSTSSARIFSSQSSAFSERDVASFNSPYQGDLNSWEEQATVQAIDLHPERNALLYCAREWLSNSNAHLETGDSAFPISSQNSTDVRDEKFPLCIMKQSALDMPKADKERLRRELEETITRAIPENGSEESCWICETSEAEEREQKVTRRFYWRDRRFPLKRQGRRLQQQIGTLWIIVEGTMSPSQKYGWTFESWHLSHLCGNWRCVNPAHHTIEPGSDNQDRKNCHNGNRPHHACKHKPRCLMHFKNGKPKGIMPLSSPETSSKKYFQSTLANADGLMKITKRQPSTKPTDLAKMCKKRKALGKDSARYMKQKKINFN